MTRSSTACSRRNADGSEGDQPADVYTSVHFADGDDRLKVDGLAVAPRAAGTTVTWRFEEAKVQKWSIFGFNVYRAEAGGDRFQKINADPQGGPSVEGGYRFWLYVDKTADEGRKYAYAVAPVNVFHNELPTRTVAAYGPASTQPVAAAAPVLRELHQTPAKLVALSWTFDPKQEDQITGFVVERADLPSRTLRAISKALPPSARDFTDEAAKKNDESFAYRVTAIGASGPVGNSNQMIAIYVDAPVPPRPAGVQARFAKVNDKRFVHLTWSPKAAGDAVTEGYVLYADNDREGKVLRQSSIPAIKDQEYFWEVSNLQDRTFTVGIAAVGRGGQESESAVTRCFAPGSLMAAVNGLTVTRGGAPAATLDLAWQYPPVPHLAGFRVSEGGVVLADEHSVRAAARGWRLEHAAANKAYSFEVVAVSNLGVVSLPARITYAPQIAGQARPGKPAGFTAAWVGDEGKKQVLLRWAAPGPATPVTYEMSVDRSAIGILEEPAPIEVAAPGEYTFAPPNDQRTYSFRLWSVSPSGAKSVYAEAQCLAPGRVLPPASLPPFWDIIKDRGGKKIHWTWEYPDAPGLAGFRIYQDGVVIAGEDKLGKDVREWTTPVLTAKARHTFEIEAVSADGHASERGGPQKFSYEN